MSVPTNPSDRDTVIVTGAAQIRALIEDAVIRAVRNAVAEVAEVAAERPESDWITLREAEGVYRRSRSTLYRWRRDGLIETREIGGSVYVRRT